VGLADGNRRGRREKKKVGELKIFKHLIFILI
jgi:hypothetical protein